MSAWEEFSSAYAEAAAMSLPLHRAVVAVLGGIGSLAVLHQTHKSIFESVLRIELSNFTAMDTPLLKDAVLGNIAVGITAALVGLTFSRFLLRLVFGLAERSTSLLQRAKSQSLAATGQHLNPEQRKVAAELLSSALEQPRKRLRNFNSSVEVCTGISALFSVFAYWGNILDVLVAAFFGLLAILQTIRSTQYFLSEYFGPAMVKAEVEGRRPPSTEDLL